MGKTVLYIGPSYFGYEKIIQKLIKEHLNYKVYYIDLMKFSYKYKNIIERIYNNIYYKNIKKENLKDIKISNMIINEVKKLDIEKIDIIFYLRPQGTSRKLIEFLYSLNKEMICHQWDSLNSLDGIEKYLKYFNKLSSFDPIDCKEYGMKFIPNFYINNESKEKISQIYYDAFTVMSYDSRFEEIEEIAKILKSRNMKYLFLIYVKDKNIKIKSDLVTIIRTPISLEETYNYIRQSKSLVEIGHLGKQRGLSFRAIESLGLRKKLITNYSFIKEYDFYDKRNIFVIENKNLEIPIEFFETSYTEIPKDIYEKYSGKTWIENIFF